MHYKMCFVFSSAPEIICILVSVHLTEWRGTEENTATLKWLVSVNNMPYQSRLNFVTKLVTELFLTNLFCLQVEADMPEMKMSFKTDI